MKRKLKHPSQPGFTLIELLVVTAIVGILAALLCPALNRANASARLTACKSNLRQTGLGLSLYLNDFGTHPLQGYSGRKEIYLDWAESLAPYRGGNSNLCNCPAESPPFRPWVSYDYNDKVTGGLGLARFGPTQDDPIPVSESQVLVPSEMIVIGDRDGFWGDSISGFGWPGYPVSQPLDHSSNNATFYDGHVETSYSDRIPTRIPQAGWPPLRFIPDSAHARRWNIDNQPHPETWPGP